MTDAAYVPLNLQPPQETEEAIAAAVSHAFMLGRAHIQKAETWNVSLEGARVLELGPGTDFGSTMIMACHGASVTVADAWLPAWRPLYHAPLYAGLAALVRKEWPQADTGPLERLIESEGRDSSVIVQIPVGAENLPVESMLPFDFIISNAVFEHIPNVEKASGNLFAVTRPGGVNVHQVDFRDHRQFDRPLDYLLMSADEEDRHLAATEYHFGSQRRRNAYDSAFLNAGFELLSDWVSLQAEPAYFEEILPQLRAAKASRYHDAPEEILSVLGITYALRRPADAAPGEFVPVNWRKTEASDSAIREAANAAFQIGKGHIQKARDWAGGLEGKNILELGPGPDFGSTMMMACFGARVAAADRWLAHWDDSHHPHVYAMLAEMVTEEYPEADVTPLQRLSRADCHDPAIIRQFATGAELLTGARDGSFDFIISNAVFEHLDDIYQSCKRLFEVTAPGGVHFHQVDLRDHRNFDEPLEYLLMSAEEEDAFREETKFHFGSQRRREEYEAAFTRAGFEIVLPYVDTRATPDYLAAFLPRLRAASGSRYQSYDEQELGTLGIGYVVRRP